MRNAFADEITALAGQDERIVLLSGDIGNRLFNGYKRLYPSRFFNCGVAEANMIGMASGMALCGLRPVTYTIAAFNTVRCLEQIRIDLCYANLPVMIVGVGAGLSYAENGATHEACEDIAFMRILPNMTVICPADVWEVRSAIREALKIQGPSYIRLGKKDEPVLHERAPDFRIGKVIVLRKGTVLCLMSTGNMAAAALEASELLAARGVSVAVVSFHTVKPLDEDFLADAFQKYRIVVTLEEHSILGGFGGSVAEWVCNQRNSFASLIRIGTPDSYRHEASDQKHARAQLGLTAERICERLWSAYVEGGKVGS